LFAESALILELGRHLVTRWKLDTSYVMGTPDARADIEKRIRAAEEKIEFAFTTKKDRAKAALLRNCCLSNESTKLDLRLVRILSFFAGLAVLCPDHTFTIFDVAKAVCTTDDVAQLLENRRVIATWAVERGVIEVRESSGHTPRVVLAGKLVAQFLGGAACIPEVSADSVSRLRKQMGDKRTAQSPNTAPSAPNQPEEQPQKPKAFSTGTAELVAHLRTIPILSPAEMDQILTSHGYIGQAEARRAICLAAFRHVQRLRRIYVENVNPRDLPKRENILCFGRTGVGKTFLLSILFDKVLKLPSIIVDSTRYSETGYVGDKVEWALTRLVFAANGNIPLAQAGLVCWDEIDKIAGNGVNRASFSGQGSTKDVSCLGVQRGLLKILEGAVIDVPMDIGDYGSRSQRIQFRTDNALFVGCGAFSGLEFVRGRKKAIGFGLKTNAVDVDGDGKGCPATDFAKYGLLEELVGRFGLMVRFEDLSVEQMKAILEKNTISQYRRELALGGLELIVDPAVADLLVRRALESKTGARALSSSLASVLTDACYQAYSSKGVRRIRLYVDGGVDGDSANVGWEIQKAANA